MRRQKNQIPSHLEHKFAGSTLGQQEGSYANAFAFKEQATFLVE